MGGMRPMVSGMGAGLAATIAMSAVMFASKRAGFMGRLPPKRITEGLLDRLRIRRSEETDTIATTAAHLGYGAVFGGLFGLLRKRFSPSHSVPWGLTFAATLWAASYLGWVPALALMPHPKKDRPDRPASMLAAHLVYGAVLGRLAGSRPRSTTAPM